MKNNNIPQMLKEILDGGYGKKASNYFMKPGMFSYINSETRELKTYPNKKMIVLEGLPGAGKTTIKDCFIDNNNVEAVDQILPDNPEDDSKLTLAFIKTSEKLKTEKFNSSMKKIVLFDRYYVSTLAYHWAYDAVFKTSTFEEVYRWYLTSLKAREINKPFLILYIKIPTKYAFSRKKRISSKTSNNPWLRADFLEKFVEYYEYFFLNIEPETLVININGDKPFKKVIEEVKKYVV